MAEWKARQVGYLLQRNRLSPMSMVEVGCGPGYVLKAISERYEHADLTGYDISPQAIELAAKHSHSRLKFRLGNAFLASDKADILLALDVMEHVPDYLGFLAACTSKATYQVYHIPLDLHVSATLRDSFLQVRQQVGHLHYFSASTALASLTDTGHVVLDCFYTSAAIAAFNTSVKRRTLRGAVAYIPRLLLGSISKSLAARLLGGYSLMILCRARSN